MKKLLWLTGLALSVSFMLACPRPALADSISDTFTVFSPTGAIFASVSVNESSENPDTLYYIHMLGLAKIPQYGNPTVLLDSKGSISDIFGVASVGDQYYLGFQSDSENSPLIIDDNDFKTVPEGSGVFDATKYLKDSLQDAGYKATFVSDADNTPEPDSISLLVIGLLGLAVMTATLRKEIAPSGR